MNCQEIQELFVEYPDFPIDDIRRVQVQEHIRECVHCAAEFKLWEESTNWINDSSPFIKVEHGNMMSHSVMNRIYSDESWRIPVPEKIYLISYKLRRNLMGIIAFFLTLFIFSFLYTTVFEAKPEPIYSFQGIIPVASAIGDPGETTAINATLQGVPVASISDPSILGINPIKAYPDYLVAVSLLGIIVALLIMNWFSRIKT